MAADATELALYVFCQVRLAKTAEYFCTIADALDGDGRGTVGAVVLRLPSMGLVTGHRSQVRRVGTARSVPRQRDEAGTPNADSLLKVQACG